MYNDIILEESGSLEYFGSEPVEKEDVNEDESSLYDEALIEEDHNESDPADEVSESSILEPKEEDNNDAVLEDIKNDLEVIKNDIRVYKTDGMVDSSDSDDSELRSDSEIITLSEDNIITKPLTDYTVSESLIALVVVGLFVAGMVYMIKRSLFKWN